MWIKKHWNDPITVGGYTKLCIWSFVITCVVVLAEVVYFAFRWYDWGYKIKEFGSAIIHKIKTLKSRTQSQIEEEL